MVDGWMDGWMDGLVGWLVGWFVQPLTYNTLQQNHMHVHTGGGSLLAATPSTSAEWIRRSFVDDRTGVDSANERTNERTCSGGITVVQDEKSNHHTHISVKQSKDKPRSILVYLQGKKR